MRRHLWLGLLVGLSACSNGDGYSTNRSSLLPLADCTAAAEYVRSVALAAMNDDVDQLITAYESGQGCWGGGYGEDGADGSGSPTGGSNPSPEEGPSTGTGTNNQVQGVDEADFIKNDGNYIYLAQNGALRIVSSWPADQTHVVSTTPLEGTPKKLFVAGDKALIYTAHRPGTGTGEDGPADEAWRTECTYGYDCDFTGDGTQTRLLVYDISNRAEPVLERQIDVDGSLIAARRIGNAVHTVVTRATSPFTALDLEYFPNYDEYGDLCNVDYGEIPSLANRQQMRWLLDSMRARNAEKIANVAIDVLAPTITDTAHPSDGPTCSNLYASPVADSTAFTSILSVDLESDAPVTGATIFSRPGAVYASADALYIAVGRYTETGDVSAIHKFGISNNVSDTSYQASGEIMGRALNQFAMDERNGYLRIATTDGRAPSESTNSHMTVLAQATDTLVTVGHIGGIAPTEDIRSVRFDGTRAFIVTFKKTDPLFTFDLADPFSPTLQGELKIPGFSTYMHMLDDDHLLTIGYDADDHGDFAYFDGVMLQIFDVSNMLDPKLAHKHIIGTRGSSSEALTNHLAFTWYPEYNLLSIPMTVCEGGDDGRYGTNMTFNGLMLFDATVDDGFAEHGRVAHTVGQNVSCNNWWTNATSTVKRSLFLENYVYSVSDIELRVRDVNALGTELVTIPLQ